MSSPESVEVILRVAGTLKCITEGMNQNSIIADFLGLSRSTTHRLLKTLLAADFLFRDSLSRRYYLGPLHFNS